MTSTVLTLPATAINGVNPACYRINGVKPVRLRCHTCPTSGYFCPDINPFYATPAHALGFENILKSDENRVLFSGNVKK